MELFPSGRRKTLSFALRWAIVIALIAVGGGAKDPLWMQICSDVTGLPQEVPAQTLGAAYGDAYLAGYAVRLFTDSKPLRQDWVKIVRTIEPDPELTAVYSDLYGIYRNLYRNTQEEMHRLARIAS